MNTKLALRARTLRSNTLRSNTPAPTHSNTHAPTLHSNTRAQTQVQGMNRDYGHVFDAIELFSVIVFTLEISLRVYASPELKMSRLSYLVSFYSLVDLIAVVPYYLAFFSPILDRYDEKLRMLRILRLLKLKSAVLSMRLLGSAISSKRDALFVATFDTIVLWYVSVSLFSSNVRERTHHRYSNTLFL